MWGVDHCASDEDRLTMFSFLLFQPIDGVEDAAIRLCEGSVGSAEWGVRANTAWLVSRIARSPVHWPWARRLLDSLADDPDDSVRKNVQLTLERLGDAN
jgi:hypothetical protein